MPAYPSLTHALAEALVGALWFIEGSEDEQMDPDDAVKVLEGVAHLFSQLSADQRQELIDLLRAMAEAEPDQPAGSSWKGSRKDSGWSRTRLEWGFRSRAGRAFVAVRILRGRTSDVSA
ncbi:hypothetical protein, partial [Streptomyces katrae]|uniref:hypothetical protein n=1 Tax=Streptomyces katrae TaxID=68223 RepID=UPI00316AC82F